MPNAPHPPYSPSSPSFYRSAPAGPLFPDTPHSPLQPRRYYSPVGDTPNRSLALAQPVCGVVSSSYPTSFVGQLDASPPQQSHSGPLKSLKRSNCSSPYEHHPPSDIRSFYAPVDEPPTDRTFLRSKSPVLPTSAPHELSSDCCNSCDQVNIDLRKLAASSALHPPLLRRLPERLPD